MRAFIVAGVEVFIFLVREIWFVRVESFDSQEPVVRVMVGFEEFQPQTESCGLGLVFDVLHVMTVDPVLPAPGAAVTV